MGTSAFEILIVPVLWGTFGGCVAGAAIVVTMGAVEALIRRPDRAARASGATGGLPAGADGPARAGRSPVASKGRARRRLRTKHATARGVVPATAGGRTRGSCRRAGGG